MTDLIKTAKELVELTEGDGLVGFKKDANLWSAGPLKPNDFTALCRLLLEYHEALEHIASPHNCCSDSIKASKLSAIAHLIHIAEKALAAAGKGGKAG